MNTSTSTSTLFPANEKSVDDVVDAGEVKKERLIFEINPEALKLFDELRVRTGASTRSELFRNLLRFASASMDDLEEGYMPLLRDKDGNIFRSTGHKFLVWR